MRLGRPKAALPALPRLDLRDGNPLAVDEVDLDGLAQLVQGQAERDVLNLHDRLPPWAPALAHPGLLPSAILAMINARVESSIAEANWIAPSLEQLEQLIRTSDCSGQGRF